MSVVLLSYTFISGGGGPNWRSEFTAFLKEEEASWSSTKGIPYSFAQQSHKPSFAEVVKNTPLTGANVIPLGRSPPGLFPLDKNLVQRQSYRKSAFGQIVFPNTPAFDRILSNQKALGTSSSSSVHVQPVHGSDQSRCSRCLAMSHTRNSCYNAIKCLACLRWGHVAATCLRVPNSKGKSLLKASNGPSWFRQ